MATVAPLIRLDDVSVSFGTQHVLSRITLDVFPQQTLVLIGESGCGKSVTLKLIVGLLAPTTGEVYFAGKSVRAMRERELTAMRLHVGFLFQQSALFDSLSVFDNVAFGLRAQGQLREAEIRDRVRERLLEVGLPAAVEVKMPTELSGGMRKRVGLARALAIDPEVMLYDEPTTGLDPIMTDVINELIVQTRDRRPITSVVITHDMVTVGRTVDRVIMLYPLPRLGAAEPQIVFDGTPAEVFAARDPRVFQFVHGQAGERLQELALR